MEIIPNQNGIATKPSKGLMEAGKCHHNHSDSSCVGQIAHCWHSQSAKTAISQISAKACNGSVPEHGRNSRKCAAERFCMFFRQTKSPYCRSWMGWISAQYFGSHTDQHSNEPLEPVVNKSVFFNFPKCKVSIPYYVHRHRTCETLYINRQCWGQQSLGISQHFRSAEPAGP